MGGVLRQLDCILREWQATGSCELGGRSELCALHSGSDRGPGDQVIGRRTLVVGSEQGLGTQKR